MADDSSARGTIYVFREDHGLISGQCRVCQQWTSVDFGQITGGCPHIDVKFLDDDGGGA